MRTFLLALHDESVCEMGGGACAKYLCPYVLNTLCCLWLLLFTRIDTTTFQEQIESRGARRDAERSDALFALLGSMWFVGSGWSHCLDRCGLGLLRYGREYLAGPVCIALNWAF